MPLTFTEASSSIGTTEWSLPRNAAYASGTPVAVATIIEFAMFPQSMAVGDEFQLTFYRHINGTQRIVRRTSIIGPVTQAYRIGPYFVSSPGWDVTLRKIAGTDRTWDWSDGRNQQYSIADILAGTYEGSRTIQYFLRLAAARLFGKATVPSGDGAYAYRDDGDTKDRIVGAVAVGGRTVTTRDGT